MSRKRSASSPRPSWAAAAPEFSAMPDRSAPAQNARSPAPVSTTTRTATSARALAIASRNPCITSYDIALRRSGRLIVTRATPSPTAYTTSSAIAPDRTASTTRAVGLLYGDRSMLVLAIAVAVALILPAVTGGSSPRLIMTNWRWSPFLFAGLGIQLLLEFNTIPKSRWDDLGYGLLLLSYALIIVFCARNLLLKGMVIVLIGVCC